jgi:methionyl aminopeptidase
MCIISENDYLGVRQAGRVVAAVLAAMRAAIRPGITTLDLDRIAIRRMLELGARSAPFDTYGFPGATCISVNEEAVHGVPDERVLKIGDLVTLDVAVLKDGYVADAAATVPVEPLACPERRALLACAERALFVGLREARAGQMVNAIGRAVENAVHEHGFTIIPEFCGHGVGASIHEEPTVPSYFDPVITTRLKEGMVLTVEPIVAAGAPQVELDADGWTLKACDGRPVAHFEHTVIITRGAPLVLTGAPLARVG